MINRKKEFDEYAKKIINPSLPYGYRLKPCRIKKDSIITTGGIESILTFDGVGTFNVNSPVPFGDQIVKLCDLYLEGHPEIKEIRYGFDMR